MVVPRSFDTFEIARIRYRGTYDFQKLMKTINGWLNGRKYKSSEGRYVHKEGPQGDLNVVSIYGFKKPSEWAKVDATIDVQTRGTMNVEVIKNGQKQMMQEGLVIVDIKGSIKLDPYDRFSKTPWMEKLRNFINEYVLQKDIFFILADSHQLELLDLHRKVKEVLEFETPISAK